MVLKDLKKISISAKTMSWTVASLFAADGADRCTGYTIQVFVTQWSTKHDCNTGTSLCTSPVYMTHGSLIPRPEEEEKGPAVSCLRMRIIVVEFHCFRILLIYFHTLVTPNIDTTRYTVCRFTIAAYFM